MVLVFRFFHHKNSTLFQERQQFPPFYQFFIRIKIPFFLWFLNIFLHSNCHIQNRVHWAPDTTSWSREVILIHPLQMIFRRIYYKRYKSAGNRLAFLEIQLQQTVPEDYDALTQVQEYWNEHQASWYQSSAFSIVGCKKFRISIKRHLHDFTSNINLD